MTTRDKRIQTIPDGDDDPNSDADDDAAQGEFIEIEHDGGRYKVPKELESALMMRADTREDRGARAASRTG